MYAREVPREPRAEDPHADIAAALHDVSNALTIILGWVSEARSEEAPASVAHALGVIEDQARIAQSLARAAIGAAPPNLDAMESLDDVVRGALSALEVEASQAGVVLATESTARGVRVARPADVRQIVTNLVMNALAFSPRGGKVKVVVDAAPSTPVIEVSDEGPGIPEERRARIFEGGSSRAGGAGIGLRHSLSLARDGGGDLELLRSAQGTSFKLTWPRAGSRSIAPPPSKKDPVLAGTRVLVVEDDEHVTTLLEAALGARGAVVTIARDRSELSLALAAGQHDTALIDLSPIAADVQGAVDALRQSSPKATLVFISGSSAGLPDALVGEEVVWVRKPFEVSEIVSALVKAREGA
jgi:CheY-like chemotaxis protein